jgi:hypothetical protein
VFILVLVGVMDFGFMLYDRMTIINAAREGAQYGSSLATANWPNMATLVPGQVDNVATGLATTNPPMQINVTCWVPNLVPATPTWTLCSGCTTTPTISCPSSVWNSTGLQGDAVQVTVTYKYSTFFPLFFGTSIDFSSSDRMVIYPPPTT